MHRYILYEDIFRFSVISLPDTADVLVHLKSYSAAAAAATSAAR